MEDRKHFNPDDLLERAVNAVLRDPIPDELPPDQLGQLVAAVQQAANQPCPVTLLGRIKNLRWRTRIVVAASLLVILLGLGSWLLPGGGLAQAFADVAAALNNVQSATWKSTVVSHGPRGKTITYEQVGMFLAPSHERWETPAKGTKIIQIIDGQKGKTITLDPAAKTATVVAYKAPPPDDPAGKTFEHLQKLVADVQDGKAEKVQRLGTQSIDGHRAEGFHIQLGTVDVKIWIDSKTSLPTRVDEFAAITDAHARVVMTDFQVNANLDKSLFSLDAPPGYTVEGTLQVDDSESPWAKLVEVLKIAAESNDGVFPPTLRAQAIDDIQERATKALLNKNRKASSAELEKLYRELSITLVRGGTVLLSLAPDTWHYAGKDVKLGTLSRPIFWVTPKKGGRCIVIYADSSIQEADRPPNLPNAQPVLSTPDK